MDFVKDHMSYALELRVVQQPFSEDAQRCEDAPGIRRLGAEGDLVADVLSQTLTPLLRDALCQRCSCELPRLHDQDLGLRASVEDELRYLRRLAATGLADEQAHLAVPDLLNDILPLLESRKLLALVLELRIARLRPPLFDHLLHELDGHADAARRVAPVQLPNIVRGYVALGVVGVPRNSVRAVVVHGDQRGLHPCVVVGPVGLALLADAQGCDSGVPLPAHWPHVG
mmetsp:Transcript_26423/g.76248  ORF Transcript_26423/g.76248 Transcript_26423/m.76248 type:complete len:228 (-) Transcript_26423:402-1085(-)